MITGERINKILGKKNSSNKKYDISVKSEYLK